MLSAWSSQLEDGRRGFQRGPHTKYNKMRIGIAEKAVVNCYGAM